MHELVMKMLEKYQCKSQDDYLRALREILQEIALLGLWRSGFFKHAVFYGGTALRLLYGLNRFSEDLDFSLLSPQSEFDFSLYFSHVKQEMKAFYFDVDIEKIEKKEHTSIHSTFIKSSTLKQLIAIETPEPFRKNILLGQKLRIKLEVDTQPPSGFFEEIKYVLQPLPFAIKTMQISDLFAGKIHALLCRNWKTRVKGRDWYDFVWYVTFHPQLHLFHLEQRMRQTKHYHQSKKLSEKEFIKILYHRIDELDVKKAQEEVKPFIQNADDLLIWSRDFFKEISKKIVCV